MTQDIDSLFPKAEKDLDDRITQKIRRDKEEHMLPPNERPTPQLFIDVWKSIINDSWMYPVAWGKPRTGKTTVGLKTAFDVYEDWDTVIQSVVFTLAGVLYKMKKGEPQRIWTLNGLHHRVPFLIGDDWAAQNNKAKTQHEPAWDIFKGAFDTLGTKVAVFMVNMNNPAGITEQLQTKYTHEVYVESRGVAKYDKVDWQQNFNGWQAKQDKDWLQTFEFKPAPADVYKEYDEMRMNLVDELFQVIDDAMIESDGLRVLRRLNDDDINLIELMQSRGELSNEWFCNNPNWREVLKRCKARNIIVPVRKGTAYWYDLTDFGFNLYELIQVKRQEGALPPKAIPACAPLKLSIEK